MLDYGGGARYAGARSSRDSQLGRKSTEIKNKGKRGKIGNCSREAERRPGSVSIPARSCKLFDRCYFSKRFLRLWMIV